MLHLKPTKIPQDKFQRTKYIWCNAKSCTRYTGQIDRKL